MQDETTRREVLDSNSNARLNIAPSVSAATQPKQNTSAEAINTQTQAAQKAEEQKQIETQKAIQQQAQGPIIVPNTNVVNNNSSVFTKVEPRNTDDSYFRFMGGRMRVGGVFA